VRNWFNQGLHVNLDGGQAPGCIAGEVGKGSLRYLPEYGDIAPGRVGNGRLEYELPVAEGAFRRSVLRAENLVSKGEDGKSPALHLENPELPGVLELRMPSSYVYLTGKLSLEAAVGEGGKMVLYFSGNNGLDWKEVSSLTSSGRKEIDLKPVVFRRYDYRLRLVMEGAGTGLDGLAVSHDIQHSQRPLPALTKGTNTIRFAAGAPEGTVTIEGSTQPEDSDRQLVLSDFHPTLKNIRQKFLKVEGASAEVTFPIQTPGEMVRLRIGINYRARDERDAWDVQVSYDNGETFASIGRCQGPRVNFGKSIVTSDIPPGTRSALVRFSGTQRNTTCIFNLRIDADYREPFGGYRPVAVTYVWEEKGIEKRHVHIARKPEETYRIKCDATPLMKSLILELAD